MTEYKPAWEATWEGLAEVLAADKAQRKRAERTARAKSELREPPEPRSHTERMKAAQGVQLHSDDMRILAGERRRIAKHRGHDE